MLWQQLVSLAGIHKKKIKSVMFSSIFDSSDMKPQFFH